MRLSFTSIVFFVAFSFSFARIGETLEQCIQRYGPPVGVPAKNDPFGGFSFTKGEFFLVVDFLDNVAVSVTFKKIGDTPDVKTFPISEAEIQELLLANSGGAKWSFFYETIAIKNWIAKRSKFQAFYSKTDYLLYIREKDGAEKLQSLRDQRSRDNLKGF